MTNYEVKIYNVLGEIVYQKPINAHQLSFTLKQPAGIYNVQIMTEKGCANKKLIIE